MDHTTEEKDNKNVILLKDHLFIHQLNINIYTADDYYDDIIKRLEKINKKYWDEEIEEELKENQESWSITNKVVRKMDVFTYQTFESSGRKSLTYIIHGDIQGLTRQQKC